MLNEMVDTNKYGPAWLLAFDQLDSAQQKQVMNNLALKLPNMKKWMLDTAAPPASVDTIKTYLSLLGNTTGDTELFALLKGKARPRINAGNVNPTSWGCPKAARDQGFQFDFPMGYTHGKVEVQDGTIKHVPEETGMSNNINYVSGYFNELREACRAAYNSGLVYFETQQQTGHWRIHLNQNRQIYHIDSHYENSAWVN